MTDPSHIDFLKERYDEAREKYRPREIKTLLIAEAPPCSLDRYFYFEDVQKQDSLFLEIMGVLYPNEKEKYLRSKRDPARKEDLLNHFKEDGFWLMDLADVPPEATGLTYKDALPSLLSRLEKNIDKSVLIILIKASVYDICYDVLKAKGYNVLNERLPFPGSGQQLVFREKFMKLIK
jgi:hypothetical protein